jgi:hypothetical protein
VLNWEGLESEDPGSLQRRLLKMPYKEGKKWRGVIKINGKRLAQRSFLSKREAVEWEMAERKELQSQTRTVFLLEAGTSYLDYCNARYSKETYSDKKRVIKELLSKTENIPIDQVTSKQILEILLSKSTKNLYNRTRKDIHAFFNHCVTFYGLSKNPVSGIEKLPVERKPQPVPTEEEFIKLLIASDR